MVTRKLVLLNWIVQDGMLLILPYPSDTIHSEQTIVLGNEQLIPEWGISITYSTI